MRRYKRFLADVRLENGQRITMHCANTGAMLGCSTPGSVVYYSTSKNLNRKYPQTLEYVQSEQDHLVCVNTAIANKVVGEALNGDDIAEVQGLGEWQSEIRIPDEAGRFDFGIPSKVYIEVKSVTYLNDKRGLFPDATSARATKHVKALVRRIKAGGRGILLFCVPHTGIERTSIAKQLDPTYYEAVREALDDGLEVLAYRCQLTLDEVKIDYAIPFTLD